MAPLLTDLPSTSSTTVHSDFTLSGWTQRKAQRVKAGQTDLSSEVAPRLASQPASQQTLLLPLLLGAKTHSQLLLGLSTTRGQQALNLGYRTEDISQVPSFKRFGVKF